MPSQWHPDPAPSTSGPDSWYALLAAVLQRAVEDVRGVRRYGLTDAERVWAQADALRFLQDAAPLFDLVGIDHGAAMEKVSRENITARGKTDPFKK